MQRVVLRLHGVEPPGVHPGRDEPLGEPLPVEVCGGLLREVDPRRPRHEGVRLLHRTAELAVALRLRPDAQHHPHAVFVAFVDHALRIRKALRVPLHRVPRAAAPPLPVLHNHRKRQVAVLEVPHRLQEVVLRHEALLAVPVAPRPVGEHGGSAHVGAEVRDSRLRRAEVHDVVRPVRNVARERRLAPVGTEGEPRAVLRVSDDAHLVGARLERGAEADRRREPHVLVVNCNFAVDLDVLHARHVPPAVEHEGALAVRPEFERPFEHDALALFLRAAAFGRNEDFRLLPVASLGERDLVRAFVELDLGVVVPVEPPAARGDEERRGYLRVHLREPAREIAHVELSVLELAESEQPLVRRRVERNRLRADAALGEYRRALLVLEADEPRPAGDDGGKSAGHDARLLRAFRYRDGFAAPRREHKLGRDRLAARHPYASAREGGYLHRTRVRCNHGHLFGPCAVRIGEGRNGCDRRHGRKNQVSCVHRAFTP